MLSKSLCLTFPKRNTSPISSSSPTYILPLKEGEDIGFSLFLPLPLEEGG